VRGENEIWKEENFASGVLGQFLGVLEEGEKAQSVEPLVLHAEALVLYCYTIGSACRSNGFIAGFRVFFERF